MEHRHPGSLGGRARDGLGARGGRSLKAVLEVSPGTPLGGAAPPSPATAVPRCSTCATALAHLPPGLPCSQDAERLLCAQRGVGSWQEYLQQAQAGGAGAPCTFVWTAGTIAYRQALEPSRPTAIGWREAELALLHAAATLVAPPAGRRLLRARHLGPRRPALGCHKYTTHVVSGTQHGVAESLALPWRAPWPPGAGLVGSPPPAPSASTASRSAGGGGRPGARGQAPRLARRRPADLPPAAARAAAACRAVSKAYERLECSGALSRPR